MLVLYLIAAESQFFPALSHKNNGKKAVGRRFFKPSAQLLRDFCVPVKGRNYMTFPALMTVLARLLPTR